MNEIKTFIWNYFCDERNAQYSPEQFARRIIFMSACSTTSLGGIIKTKRSAVITHRSADQDVGAGVARAGKSLGHAMKRAAWVLQVLGMHRLTGWCTCCRESGFRETHKLEINEVQKKKGAFNTRQRTFSCQKTHHVKSNSTRTRWKFSLDGKVGLCMKKYRHTGP